MTSSINYIVSNLIYKKYTFKNQPNIPFSMTDTPEIFEKLYSQGKTPWTNPEIPEEIKFLTRRTPGGITPIYIGKSLNIGCGQGYHDIYLAKRGFDHTAIDISEEAIKQARQNAFEANVSIDFIQMDWRDLNQLPSDFDFAMDWRFLHELTDQEDRKQYVKLVSERLHPNSAYLSASFSDQTKLWGKEKIRTPENSQTTLYFSSLDEYCDLMKPYFTPVQRNQIEVPSHGAGIAVCNQLTMVNSLHH